MGNLMTWLDELGPASQLDHLGEDQGRARIQEWDWVDLSNQKEAEQTQTTILEGNPKIHMITSKSLLIHQNLSLIWIFILFIY